jgi:hypothetical protein
VALLSGSFSGAEIGSFGFTNLLIAEGEDFKYSPLLSHYGLSGAGAFGFSLTALSTGSPVADDPFDLTAFSTNVVNTEIPEPSTVTLFVAIIMFAALRPARDRVRRHIATR